MALPLFDRAASDLPKKLIQVLSDGTWQRRSWLALHFGVSTRTIRDAASATNGVVISGQRGLRLTVYCSAQEVDDALGQQQKQVSATALRIAKTRYIWEQSQRQSA